jgi:hypothetical protein
MIDPLMIVVCSFFSKMTPRCPKRLPGDEYTGESQLPGGEYTGESQLLGGEYIGESRLPSDEYPGIDFLVYFEQA